MGIAHSIVERAMGMFMPAKPRSRVILATASRVFPPHDAHDEAWKVDTGTCEKLLSTEGAAEKTKVEEATQIPIHPKAVEGERMGHEDGWRGKIAGPASIGSHDCSRWFGITGGIGPDLR